MLFMKEDLQTLLWDSAVLINGKEALVVENELYDASRWSLHYNLVFTYDGKFYKTGYSCGATESQDEEPFEHFPDEIAIEEVVPVEVTRIEYHSVLS